MLGISSKDPSVSALSFDFMQNIQLPKTPVQDVYYLRQLTYNLFSIQNLGQNKSKIYTYHEGLAKKGANEVVSFIWDYIQYELSDSVKHLHLFSDATCGQNRNNTMIRFCMSLVNSGRFESVTQYFPIRGHSFLPNDRDFAIIKRDLKKNARIYLPKQITRMIVKHEKFIVTMVEPKDVIDFDSWWPKFYKKTCIANDTSKNGIPNDEKQQFKVTQFFHFFYSKSHEHTVLARKLIDHTKSFSFQLFKKKKSIYL